MKKLMCVLALLSLVLSVNTAHACNYSFGGRSSHYGGYAQPVVVAAPSIVQYQQPVVVAVAAPPVVVAAPQPVYSAPQQVFAAPICDSYAAPIVSFSPYFVSRSVFVPFINYGRNYGNFGRNFGFGRGVGVRPNFGHRR